MRSMHLSMQYKARLNLLPMFLVLSLIWSTQILLGSSKDRVLNLHHQHACDKSRTVLTEPEGKFSSGPVGVNYTQDSHCEWLIKAKNSSQFITLTFHSLVTECSYDYIYVYDGESFNSTLLGTFSGKIEPQNLVANSGNMLVLLYSDTNYVLDGFNASYIVSNCLNSCHHRGKCVNHQCVCLEKWLEPDCENLACPENCGEQLGYGKCENGTCKCAQGYSGKNCDLSDNPNGGNWRLLATYAEGLHPRAAHTAVYVESLDSLYVFGGYDLNHVLDRHQVYRFETGTWENAEVSTNINTRLEGNNQTDTKKFGRPSGRYGHAAAAIPNGFTMFGGKLANGSLSNELWIYNVTGTGGLWSLRALNSHTMPPALTRHTMTMANNYLYVFGGSLENGEFSSSIYRIKCSLEADDEQWEKVHVRGGKDLDVRIVAHSTIFYKYTNSLIVYGGITASVARFSKLSDKIFAFQLDKLYWTEILYPRTPLRDYHIPRERAFHSTVVAANYLIVFGGYIHRHKKEEICYDNQMYLYHLECHTWVKQDVLGVVSEFQYPKKQGVFAHAAAIRKNNTLLIVGGYHGNMNADLFAYELPLMFRASGNGNYNLEIFCKYHQSVSSCISDPECGWCPADSSCYGRTSGATCTTNLQTTRCPGICPSLGDCHSCLIHGTSWEIPPNALSVSNKLGLNKCAWCVQNARCHHKEDSYGVCGEDTPSHEPGWWGKKGTDVFEPHYCAELDHLPGLTFVKYYHPTNWSMPDFVSIVNATMVDFTSPIPTTHTEFTFNGEMIARLLGFVRPRKIWKSDSKSLHLCSGFSSTILRTKVGNSLDKADLVLNTSTEQSSCYSLQWPSFTEKFVIDFQAKRKVGLGSYNNQYQQSKMELRHWNHGDWKAFTFEYLEPYSRGFCSQYTNCLQCLTDSLCGWCDLSNKCISRKQNEMKTCWNENEWKYIIIQPDKCPNCSNFITCEQCISTGLCEWWVEDARCARLGRSLSSIKHKKECPASCNDRTTCSECLTERGRCVWCEATSQCFSFAVYTSEYQFGICREWLDQTMLQVTIQADSEARGIYFPAKIQQCKSCSQHKNCSSCLRSLSCGWCYDRGNPVDGHCLQGNFNHSISGCGGAVNSLSASYDWAYAQCPDVDECEHAIYNNCHMEATCTNTYGSFECYCRRGFTGDGRRSCIRSCYEHCIHGYCSGPPDYVCKCDLGWTGIDCSTDCGCHNHSSCTYKIGKCDSCQNMTDGETCERCRVGSYGNATSTQGCKPCECNNHGDEKLGTCDVRTGECFCKDNTGGEFCQKCIHPYYGDPQGGEECYYQCSSRATLTKFGRSGIGSRQLNTLTSNFVEALECLWFVTAPTETIHSNATSTNSLTVFEIDILGFHVFCDENAVYVFEGWPNFDNKFKSNHIHAVLCSPESSYRIFESRSDLLSVHYKQGRQEYEFKAMVTIKNCAAGTCTLPHICDSSNRCLCPNGYLGPKCEIELCPKNCHFHVQQGYCDQNYGRCVCSKGYGDIDCGVPLKPYNLVVTELFDTRKLSSSFDHLKKTIPRFGHSLNADKRGFLWMFGGFSLSNGALNDIRQFDTKNGTWIQVTVDSLPGAKMPEGRYFHAAEIVQSKQSIYLYGGLTRNGTNGLGVILGDFWKFGIKNQNWEQIQVSEETPGALAGHTLTFVRHRDHTFLLLIGGVSNNDTNDLQLWEFSLERNQWQKLHTSGVHIGKIYGHSAVYHKESQMVYIFGGFSSPLGANLFAFDYKYMRWIEIPPVNVADNLLPTSIIFHSAVSTQNFMLIYGGQIGRYNSSDVLIAYNYECNQWVRIIADAQIVGQIPSRTYAASMITASENNAFYIIGGWDGSVETRVIKLEIPYDICGLWSSSKYFCRQNVGCSFCAVNSTYELSSHCFSQGNIGVCESYNGSVAYNYGAFCRNSFAVQRNCSSFRTCASCLVSWAQRAENGSSCKWCQGCHNGDSCIPAEEQCAVKSCNKEMEIKVLEQCREVKCLSLTCQQCVRSHDCAWVMSKEGWTSCISRTNSYRDGNVIINTCAIPCSAHLNCTTCLHNNVSQNNLCKWSTLLKTCIYSSLQPLYCAGGLCGLLLEPQDIGKCSGSCSSYTQCSHCLMRSECGWCSKNGKNGEGFCLEGSSDILSNGLSVTACQMFELNQTNRSQLKADFSWNYIKCPNENECENGHHSCNRVSEICVDYEAGYQCECGPGYTLKENDCIPVCNEGCVHGTCIQPDVCKCNFGYVGFNCTIQCQCNGHSQCHGPDNVHDCIQCQNNTVGLNCEKCKPLFVGDPKNNGTCFPCLQYCNGHSDVCVNRDSTSFVQNMSRNDVETNLIEGPVDDAICLRCANQTSGDRCQDCIVGYFRGSENYKDGCRACECNGHGDKCDTVTGENCNCGNNTEMDGTCSAGMIGNSAQLCWKVQCSKCKDSFLGNPTDGHQCYKHLYRQLRMSFDAKLIVSDDCEAKPSPLQSGKTVYFVIEPELDRNLMKRDIRIIVDVTQGDLDVFISPQEDSFVVYGNQTTGNHIIYLDHKYRWVNTPDRELAEPLNIAFPGVNFVKASPNSMTDKYTSWLPFMKDCPTLSGTGFLVKNVRAANLSTIITLKECNTVLRGFGIQNRLIVIVPHNSYYNSNSTRFFIVLRASINSRDVYGTIVFKQDYMHINLFMIFSVIISFFLLFSAVCIVGWKANQAANFRRVQRQHNVEMGVMARRPHAYVSVVLSDPNSSPTKNTNVIQSHTPTFSDLTICPVAIEPTQDNNAAVATVLVLRPGNHNTPVAIALGSVLIRHNVVIQRSFLGK